MPKPVFDVAVALVCRDGLWLVAKRRADAHLGGFWEFPGGKCARGESPTVAALRELKEECDVRAIAVRALHPCQWDYGDRVVNITPVVCRYISGDARPLESDDCRWVSRADLEGLEMPAVNGEILRALDSEL